MGTENINAEPLMNLFEWSFIVIGGIH